jgi:hypothetical protein
MASNSKQQPDDSHKYLEPAPPASTWETVGYKNTTAEQRRTHPDGLGWDTNRGNETGGQQQGQSSGAGHAARALTPDTRNGEQGAKEEDKCCKIL